jgi:hypothetical protein
VNPATAPRRIVWVVDRLPDRCHERAGMIAVSGSPAWLRNGRWNSVSIERRRE